MNRDSLRHNEAVEPLLAALRDLEAAGLSRPANASLNEYLTALVEFELLPQSLARRVAAHYHTSRYGHAVSNDLDLLQTVEALRQATAAFQARGKEQQAFSAEQLAGRFRPKAIAALVRKEHPAPQNSAKEVAEPETPTMPAEPAHVVAVQKDSKWLWTHRKNFWIATAAVVFWTLGMFAGGYILHDRVDAVVATVEDQFGWSILGRRNGSDRSFRAARESRPSLPSRRASMLKDLASVYHSTNRAREALYAYHLALQVDPANATVLNELAWLLLTTTDDSIRDPIRALELAKTSVELRAECANLDTLAEAWFQIGEVERAIEVEERAVDAMRSSEHRAHLATQMRKFTQALETKERNSGTPKPAAPDDAIPAGQAVTTAAESKESSAIPPSQAQTPLAPAN